MGLNISDLKGRFYAKITAGSSAFVVVSQMCQIGLIHVSFIK